MIQREAARALMPIALAMIATLSLPACSGDALDGAGGAGGGEGAGAKQGPFDCPAGQTYWVAADGKSFDCLNSGLGKVGEACQNLIGSPTCAEGLTCFSI